MNSDSYYVLFLFKVVLFILGVSFVATTIIIKKSYDNKIKNCTALAQGVVADWTLRRVGNVSRNAISSHHNGRSWFPTYEFELGGQVMRVNGNVGHPKPGQVGVPVTIHYNPMNPNQIYINENEGKIFELIFGLVGVAFLVIAIILTIVIA